MNAREAVLLDYADIPEGFTKAGEYCPACHGGATEERTLSVTKEGGTLKWYCHRASCGFRGTEVSSRVDHEQITRIPHSRGVFGRAIKRQSVALPDKERQYLEENYCITQAHVARFELGWDSETQRVVVPVRNYAGDTLGVVLRSLDKAVKPKTLTHTEQGAISWFTNQRATHPGVIIVEDQWSAIRCSDYMNSVALLGTHLNEERVDELRASKLQPIYLALDADAWNVAVRYAIKYRPIQLVRLTKDIKDLTNEECSALFDGLSAVGRMP